MITKPKNTNEEKQAVALLSLITNQADSQISQIPCAHAVEFRCTESSA